MGLLTQIWNRVARARATDSGEGQARFLHDLLASTAYHGPSDDEYVEKSGQPLTVNAPKLIAFYLPQFHPIAENDSSWGEGFTEWTNTTKALPQFAGHYQPRLPGALGFYDLRLGDVQVKQAELAKLYGIGGFCYHYYWFAGRRVLNQPVEQMLANPKVDIPFCINWANESWSRKWDGRDDDIIVPYSPDPESDRRFIEDAIPFFRDPRYIRIDGKPLLMVYRAARLSDARAVIEHWRARTRREGLPGLYVVCALSHLESAVHTYGVDAAVEFPPHGLAPINRTANYLKHNPHYSGLIASYAETVAAECAEKKCIHQNPVCFPELGQRSARARTQPLFH